MDFSTKNLHVHCECYKIDSDIYIYIVYMFLNMYIIQMLIISQLLQMLGHYYSFHRYNVAYSALFVVFAFNGFVLLLSRTDASVL